MSYHPSRPPVQIRAAIEPEHALSLLFASSTEASGQMHELAAALRARPLLLGGLQEARRAEQLVGAIWGQMAPGRLGIVWPARLIDAEPSETGQRLYEAIHAYFRAARIRLVQAVTQTAADPDAHALQQAGYRHVADLAYLVLLLDGRPDDPSEPTAGPLQWEAFRPDRQPRLEAVLERTYEDTRDCPALNGLREPREILESYRSIGQFAPEHWLLVQLDGHDAGCLLLADHPSRDQIELVYMGLIPEARRRGLGARILQVAQQLARRAGRGQMVLSVDVANEAALALYDRAGFQVYAQRSIFVRPL